jgi:hypothetical protein
VPLIWALSAGIDADQPARTLLIGSILLLRLSILPFGIGIFLPVVSWMPARVGYTGKQGQRLDVGNGIAIPRFLTLASSGPSLPFNLRKVLPRGILRLPFLLCSVPQKSRNICFLSTFHASNICIWQEETKETRR